MTNQEIKDKVWELKLGLGDDFNASGIEMLDVVNDTDEVVGVLPRDVVWENGLEHNVRAVNIFLVNEFGEILMQTRSAQKKFWPGAYDYSCGESLVAGESYEQAVVRGLKEELGIEVSGEDIQENGRFSFDQAKGFPCFGRVYVASVQKAAKVSFDQNETEKVEWKSVEEIKSLLNDDRVEFKGGFRVVFEMVFGK